MTKTILYLFLGSALMLSACSKSALKSSWTKRTAPESFTARFETTAGNFDIYAERSWSPAGVDRLYQLIRSGFYEEIAIYRVVPGFVAQFGIHNDSTLNNAWRDLKIPDEEVIELNEKGTISFARGGEETRSTQLFINLESNSPRLDELDWGGVVGFPVIAKVTSGMENVEKIYDGYGGEPGNKQDSISMFGNSYLKERYPELDYIKKAYLLKD